MSYPRGQMDKRVKIFAPVRQSNEYGQTHVQYREVAQMWAWVTWVRGARALSRGQIDVYHSVMVRSDVKAQLTPYSRLEISGKYYVIDSFHADEQLNECQITAFEVEAIDKEV